MIVERINLYIKKEIVYKSYQQGESTIFGHKFASIGFRKPQVFENFCYEVRPASNAVVIDDTRKKRNVETAATINQVFWRNQYYIWAIWKSRIIMTYHLGDKGKECILQAMPRVNRLYDLGKPMD